MSRERQIKQSEEVREKILSIASRIISEEGAEALSIRKITKEMDYSVGIVYHYFKSKDEIINTLLAEGYERILASIKSPDENLTVDESLRYSIKSYIRSALEWKEEYKAMMFSSKENILEITSVLDEDVGEKRIAFRKLIENIKKGISDGVYEFCDPEITAQAIWCAMFGLTARMIIEFPVEDSKITELIDRQVDIIMKGLLK